MMGADKKKLLDILPTFFTKFHPESTVETVTKIWKVIFINLFNLLCVLIKTINTSADENCSGEQLRLIYTFHPFPISRFPHF